MTADEIRCEFFKMLCEAPEDIQMMYMNIMGKYLDLIGEYNKFHLTKDDWIIFAYMIAVDLNKNLKN